MIDANATSLPLEVKSSATELSVSEAGQMVSWAKEDLAAGKISEAQANDIFSQLGASVNQQLAPDNRSPEVKALDAQYPPAKPQDYHIQYGIGPVTLTEPQREFDASARAWLAGARTAARPIDFRVSTAASDLRCTTRTTLVPVGRVSRVLRRTARCGSRAFSVSRPCG
jgi:hypothetical protein